MCREKHRVTEKHDSSENKSESKIESSDENQMISNKFVENVLEEEKNETTEQKEEKTTKDDPSTKLQAQDILHTSKKIREIHSLQSISAVLDSTIKKGGLTKLPKAMIKSLNRYLEDADRGQPDTKTVVIHENRRPLQLREIELSDINNMPYLYRNPRV